MRKVVTSISDYHFGGRRKHMGSRARIKSRPSMVEIKRTLPWDKIIICGSYRIPVVEVACTIVNNKLYPVIIPRWAHEHRLTFTDEHHRPCYKVFSMRQFEKDLRHILHQIDSSVKMRPMAALGSLTMTPSSEPNEVLHNAFEYRTVTDDILKQYSCKTNVWHHRTDLPHKFTHSVRISSFYHLHKKDPGATCLCTNFVEKLRKIYVEKGSKEMLCTLVAHLPSTAHMYLDEVYHPIIKFMEKNPGHKFYPK